LSSIPPVLFSLASASRQPSEAVCPGRAAYYTTLSTSVKKIFLKLENHLQRTTLHLSLCMLVNIILSLR
jgi:hypothetical protein